MQMTKVNRKKGLLKTPTRNWNELLVQLARADIIHSQHRIKEFFDPEKLAFFINSEHKST